LAILKLILDIIDIMKKDRKKQPTPDEIEEEVKKRDVAGSLISDEEVSKLIEKASDIEKGYYSEVDCIAGKMCPSCGEQTLFKTPKGGVIKMRTDMK